MSAPLLAWGWNDSVYTGQRTTAQSLISYFSRCSQAGTWDPALYFPARHSVCCMMEGGGCSGPARLILSQGRGANSRLYCCPGLPGFPWENIQRGIDAAEEKHSELFIEQVKRRGEEKKERGGGVRKRTWKTRNGGLEESESRWQSVISAADCVHRHPSRRCLQHLLNRTQPLTLAWPAGAKANKVCLNLLIHGGESSCRG